MSKTTYRGLDYGNGRTNIDKATGIRYGVISQHSVGQAWYDNAEGVYPDASCPECGSKLVEFDFDKHGEIPTYRHSCRDFACENCSLIIGSDYAYPDEPNGYKYEDKDYTLTDCLDSDIFVIKSPYFTHGQFCSPCVPGAVSLDSAIDEDTEGCPKAYCLGHDWFEDGKAPYKVYSVATGELIQPES